MPRTQKVDPDRLNILKQRLAKVQRDIRHAESLEKKQLRAADARRKIIGGALSEEHALSNPGSEFSRVYIRLLKEYVRPDERHLFEETFRALLPAHEAELLLVVIPASKTPAPTENQELDDAAE